jgi:hypothetical protein
MSEINKERSWNDLYEKYPYLFANKDNSQSPMCYGIECNLGWYNLLNSLCWRINKHKQQMIDRFTYLIKNDPEKLKTEPDYPDVKFDQIKQKFGVLRVYYSGGDEYIRGAVSVIEDCSSTICEQCGNSGSIRKGGWSVVLCDQCFEKNK